MPRSSLPLVGLATALAGCTLFTSMPEPSDGASDGGNGTATSAGGASAGGASAGGSAQGGGPATTGTTWYVATDGNNADDGSIDAPFGTIQHAIDVALPGDRIYLRGGTYTLEATVIIDKAGEEGAPIRLWAYEDETPVLDFSLHPRHAFPPVPADDDSLVSTRGANGIFLSPDSAWWHVRGLTVHSAPYYGVRIYGSHHVFERLILHDHKASGLEIVGKDGALPSHNLVVDSDSFHNFDPQDNGENADGFAAKFEGLGPGNVFRGLRAWSNSDDGYDFWHAANPIVVEDCWAFDNGFNRPEWAPQLSGSYSGDGIGFKLGQEASELVLRRVVAWGNKSFGIDENGNGSASGVTIEHATVVNNAKDGNPIQISLNDGRPHRIVNSVAFDVDGDGVIQTDGPVLDANNSWTGPGASSADFEHLDPTQLFVESTAPRDADGALPPLGLRLVPQSPLVDAGVDLGLPFDGAAPDLGAFEVQ